MHPVGNSVVTLFDVPIFVQMNLDVLVSAVIKLLKVDAGKEDGAQRSHLNRVPHTTCRLRS